MKRKKTPRGKLEEQLDKLWGLCVRARDNETCQHCGSPGNQPHHVFSRICKSSRFLLENGITLCWSCHLHQAHERHEFFRDFIIARIGQEEFDRIKAIAKTPAKFTMDDLEAIKKDLEKAFLIFRMEDK